MVYSDFNRIYFFRKRERILETPFPIPKNLPAFIPIKKLPWKKRKSWFVWKKKILGTV
jgi:hypothetical protein